jgi:hypothetical protein
MLSSDLGWDKPEQKHVSAATVVALQRRLAERAIAVELNLLALGTDQVVHDVRAGSGAAVVAEPLLCLGA